MLQGILSMNLYVVIEKLYFLSFMHSRFILKEVEECSYVSQVPQISL